MGIQWLIVELLNCLVLRVLRTEELIHFFPSLQEATSLSCAKQLEMTLPVWRRGPWESEILIPRLERKPLQCLSRPGLSEQFVTQVGFAFCFFFSKHTEQFELQ